MIDLEVAVELDGRLAAKFSSDAWEVNVYGTRDEFIALADVQSASWDERASIRSGTSAGKPVFWATTAESVLLLVGDDDETWDISVTVPTSLVAQLSQRAALPKVD